MKAFNKINFRNKADKFTVSFVIPVYKDYDGLDMTLNSIAHQQYRKCGKYTLEIIVVNDGGDREISGVCQKYKVKMVEIRPNCGSYLARNKGLEYSTGSIIIFIDADVIIPPGWLEKALSAIDAVDYLAADIRIDNNKIQTAVHSYQVSHSFPNAAYLEEDHFGVTAGLVTRRRLVEQLGGFDSRLRSGGDKEFGIRVYHAGYKQAFLPSPTLVHPPKTLDRYLRSIKRIKQGHERLALFYPDTFSRPGFFQRLARFLRSLLPPRPTGINRRFSPDDGTALLKKWFFLWLLKFFKGLYDLQTWRLRFGKTVPQACPKVTFFDYYTPGGATKNFAIFRQDLTSK
jgi:glycosyltransferase involved in cell wall biosynthesis